MRPEKSSNTFLAITRSKGKMYEYSIPESEHIAIDINPSLLFIISIGILGDIASCYSRSEEIPSTLLEDLLFSAHFFDAFLKSNLNKEIDPYLILLGATSYYLCNLPGSSQVLANQISYQSLNLDCEGLENLLAWLLQNEYNKDFSLNEGRFSQYINSISNAMSNFANNGIEEKTLFTSCDHLRMEAYAAGNPRQLLLADAILSIIKRKYENSTWHSLPQYSNLSKEEWRDALKKKSFIKELWPAQHLLGKADVLKGKSAVIQMPTSAGKTKSTELIIRSSFLAERTSLAVIIAPFRALCHEIKNSLIQAFEGEPLTIDELSDASQTDFDIEELLTNKKILIMTPEKMVYILRHNPEIASHVGLLILDEGHQFDNGIRGITYELLLTSLRLLLSENTQKIIVSAVISNAEDINTWFNGRESVVISGTNLIPTFRSVGFTSWQKSLGQIHYVSNSNIEADEFFVPRVIESYDLEKNSREKKIRTFPNKDDSKSVSLYLGLKLAPKGGIAIFCGTKHSAKKICELAVDAFTRKLPLTKPADLSDREEITKITNLYILNIGEQATSTKSAQLGIFSHHGNTSHGIRLAVEYAMREGHIRFVVCTSTLSQGVNLPIKYLIVDSFYQGAERIKTRDFHNLIGRAGRSGMHTEGSILFGDPQIYDRRKFRRENWRWYGVKELLEPSNSEPCVSNLLSLFEPIKSDDNRYRIEANALKFLDIYIDNPSGITRLSQLISKRYGDKGFSQEGVERQISSKMTIISSIESFLMSNWVDDNSKLPDEVAAELAMGTLAYSLADEEKRNQICELFKALSQNIALIISESKQRKIYGKTLYGVWDAKEINEWVDSNFNKLDILELDEIIDIIWPLISKHIQNSSFKKCTKPDLLRELSKYWIKGMSFERLYNILKKEKAQRIRGRKLSEYSVEDVVDIFENGFGYDGALLIGAIIEFIDDREFHDKKKLIRKLQLFQKKFKYGLPSAEAIILYERGFSDRVIAQQLATQLGKFNSELEIKELIMKNKENVEKLINSYPGYFKDIYKHFEPKQ